MAAQGLYQLGVKTNDLDASLAFYCNALGLRLIGRFDPPGIAFVAAGEVRLMLTKDASPAQFYLKVADVAAERDRLLALGLHFESEPILVHTDNEGMFGPEGQSEWMAFLRDPSGNLIGLVERR